MLNLKYVIEFAFVLQVKLVYIYYKILYMVKRAVVMRSSDGL